MFDPFGRFGLKDLSSEDIAAVRKLEYLVTNLRKTSGQPSLKLTRALPSGAVVTTYRMGGINKSIVRAPDLEKPATPEWPVHDPGRVPMLFSGTVKSYFQEASGKAEMEVTEQTRVRLTQYGEALNPDGSKLAKPPRDLSLTRFHIQHDDRLEELRDEDGQALQYWNVRPSWYSGAMAEVVQIVGGYGRTDLGALPDAPVERAYLAVPAEVIQAYEKEFGRHVLPGYTGVPPKDGMIKYDYKALTTHLVSFDAKGRPWLMEMRSSGAWAMPLPLVPVTTCKAFREWVEQKGDQELLSILDRFGGLPSGERFPPAKEFERWRRAGAVIKVCEMNGAHSHLPYTAANGWIMNRRGTEAYSTCHDYGDDGVGYGLMYKGSFSLVAAGEHHGWAKPLDWEEMALSPDDAKVALVYASGIVGAAMRDREDPKKMAAWFKLNNLKPAELVRRARMALPVPQAIDDLDNYEADKIAAHSGNISETRRGWLYHPAKFGNQPQVKLPEPSEKQCWSYDFSILDGGNRKFDKPCDTVMWAYFIGDDLKVIKYAYRPQKAKATTEDGYDECMIVGSWTRTGNSEGQQMCNFYHTDFDEREVMPDVQTISKTVGKDLGYDSVPCFGFAYVFAMAGSVWRNRYYSHETDRHEGKVQTKSDGFVVPFLNRSAALYYTIGQEGAGKRSQTGARHAVVDPYSYGMYTYDFVWHWHGGFSGPRHGRPIPVNSDPVWAENESFSPTLCSDFADSGPWMSLPANITWLVHPDRNTIKFSGGCGAPPYQAYSLSDVPVPVKYTHKTTASITVETQKVHDHENPEYLLACPSDELQYFYRDACRIEFGDAEYANVSEYETGSQTRKYFGRTRLADHKKAHHFIGVIHE